jgi:hypothetical protein
MLTHLSFLPETLRILAGNGDKRPPTIYRPILPIVGRGRQTKPWKTDKTIRAPFVNPLKLFVYPDVLITLLFTGIIYAVNYTVTATIASSFAAIYPFLSETALGLSYLSTGGGMLLGSTLTGKLLDHEYRVFLKKEESKAIQDEAEEIRDFPIERARLRTMPLHVGIFIAALLAWGWCLEKKVSLAGVLVIQVIRTYHFKERGLGMEKVMLMLLGSGLYVYCGS